MKQNKNHGLLGKEPNGQISLTPARKIQDTLFPQWRDTAVRGYTPERRDEQGPGSHHSTPVTWQGPQRCQGPGTTAGADQRLPVAIRASKAFIH